MAKHLALVLISVWVTAIQAAEVYQCVENGTLMLSDRPCAKEAEHQKTIPIKEPLPATASSESTSDLTSSSKAVVDLGSDEILRQKLIGRWAGKLLGEGSEDRTFYADGTFESYGKNKFAEITATGSWSLHGKKLTITADFENTMYNGDKVTVNNILKYTVKSIDDRVLKLYWPRYGSSEEWVRQ
ncbi:DUF4124 domain-containing protein [Methylophaga sp. OBS4]|uniref:DUF4124 domain-containing protein n=1 Tax=Methylophaga sp. OBS4 TaxID=2991935 RepID=UPI00224DDD14|nr:DUF4124 domain-containing protein [Methylophaga sp. OBS4]MCX4186536.1 DUF4124 domain-containing protein [Methylophaga sp. OBS4]